jgi:hypothetical protein
MDPSSEGDSSGIAERAPAVRIFLALNAKRGPWKRSEPFRVDCFFALLADSESAFAYAAQSRTRTAELFGAAVDIRNRKSKFTCARDFVQLIGAWLYRNTVTLTDRSL